MWKRENMLFLYGYGGGVVCFYSFFLLGIVGCEVMGGKENANINCGFFVLTFHLSAKNMFGNFLFSFIFWRGI